MYHSRYKGSHYQAGFRYGEILKKNGVSLENMETMIVPKERVEYFKQTEPIYKEQFPEVLEEIKGMSEGNGIEYQQLASVLLSMYSYTIYNFCTCIAFLTKDNHIVFGRNSDFLTSLEKAYSSCYYQLDTSYQFIGNTTAFVEMEDGINEHGLAVGLTFVYAKEKVPGLNAGMLVRYLLEKCKTVKECLTALETLTIGSSQTLTIVDSTEMVIVECNPYQKVIIRPKDNAYVFTTNDFQSNSMQKYRHDLEDTIHSQERFLVAKEALSKTKELSLTFMQELLSGKHGFMCQYDRKTGIDTVWSSIYDITDKRIYRVEGNPSRKRYIEDKRKIFKINNSI